MHFASFTSAAPLDHLGRVLDELRRRGFQLCGLAVTVGKSGQTIAAANDGALSEIRIDFDASNAFAADNYLARIAGIPGIRDLQGGPATRQV